jgi:aspartate 1-decarboxylase
LTRRLLDAADLLPGDQVHVINVNTGSRLVNLRH